MPFAQPVIAADRVARVATFVHVIKRITRAPHCGKCISWPTGEFSSKAVISFVHFNFVIRFVETGAKRLAHAPWFARSNFT